MNPKANKMRFYLTLLLYVFLLKNSFAQKDSTSTNIIIIGTIHTGNEQFSHKELFNTLKSIKPDVILDEESIPYKKVLGLRTGNFLRIWKPGIEQLALQKYTNNFSNYIIVPFDTTISDRRKYKRDLQLKNKQVLETLFKAKLTTEDSITLSNFTIKSNSYYEIIVKKSLKGLNEKNIIDKTRELYQIEKESINHLVKRYCSDSLLTNWYRNEQVFWELRNQYMARRIRTIASEFPGKKIVVLTGINHKYFLLDELSNYKDTFLKVIPFPGET